MVWITNEQFLQALVTSSGHQLELKVALAGRSQFLVSHTGKCEHAIRHTLEGVIIYERASHIQYKNLTSYGFVADSYEVTSSILIPGL